MIKNTLIILVLFGLISPTYSQISAQNANKLADFIYLVEGGDKTKYPYGIKSIDTGGNEAKARRICLNTINNNYKRWENGPKTNDFITFLANRYCPPSADKIGNQRWIKNMRFFIDKEKIIL